MSQSGFELARIKWETENNEHWIVMYDSKYHLNIPVEIDYLVTPFNFVSGEDNNERRISAIEQGVFKPYPPLSE